MCDFCKNIVNNDGKWKNSLLASRRSNDKNHGLDIILGKTDGKFKIEGSKFIRDAKIEEPIVYLKAVNWRKNSIQNEENAPGMRLTHGSRMIFTLLRISQSFSSRMQRKKTIRYLNSENPMVWTTSMEIHYCPVCGEKL